MSKEKKTFIIIIFQKKCKDTDITFRKWINEEREEFLVDNNAAKFLGFRNKEELINALFDTRAMDYAKGDNIWLEWDENTNTIKSITVSKPTKNAK